MIPTEEIRRQIKRLLLEAEFDPACRVEGWRLPETPPAGGLLFQTLSWGEYENFIPTYVYSVLAAYPEAFVRLIHRERLSAGVREALGLLRAKLSDHFEVLENVWPHTPFDCGMRWLLGGAWWQGFDYGQIGDVDLLIYRETPTLLKFELERARQLGKPFVNNTQIPNLRKMAGYAHFVICRPYFEALRPAQERFIDDVNSLLLRGADPTLPVQVDAAGCAYQLCIPQASGNDEFILFHLIDQSLGAPPILTPQPPWAIAHGIHLGALRYTQPWWRLVGGARPPDELEQAEPMLRDPLFRRVCACLGPWFWEAIDQLVADVVLHRQRR